MAKLIFNNKKSISPDIKPSKTFSTGFIDNKTLFKKRSENYFKLVNKLDEGVINSTEQIQEIIDQIQKELGIPEIHQMPIGIMSKCFLGHPYEVHILDMAGNIIRHYKIGEKMEPLFEPYRRLAIHNAYATIEIYKDKVLLVKENGDIVRL